MVKEVFINYGYLLGVGGVGRDDVSEGLMSMSVVGGGVKLFPYRMWLLPMSYNHGLWMVLNVSV